jgi:RNA polymerase sigma-70 factor (subfamily 1)
MTSSPSSSSGVTPPADDVVPGLVDRCQDGDMAAFGELCNRYRDRLVRYVRRNMSEKGHSRTSPEDVVQDALLTISRKIMTLEYRGLGAFEAWMLQICDGKIRDWIRHLEAAKRDVARERSLLDGDEHALAQGARLLPEPGTPSRHAYRGEKGVIVDALLDQLSERHGRVLRLRHLRGLSFGEIGREMEISEDAAKALYGRAALRFKGLAGRHPGVSDFTEVQGQDPTP